MAEATADLRKSMILDQTAEQILVLGFCAETMSGVGQSGGAIKPGSHLVRLKSQAVESVSVDSTRPALVAYSPDLTRGGSACRRLTRWKECHCTTRPNPIIRVHMAA